MWMKVHERMVELQFTEDEWKAMLLHGLAMRKEASTPGRLQGCALWQVYFDMLEDVHGDNTDEMDRFLFPEIENNRGYEDSMGNERIYIGSDVNGFVDVRIMSRKEWEEMEDAS